MKIYLRISMIQLAYMKELDVIKLNGDIHLSNIHILIIYSSPWLLDSIRKYVIVPWRVCQVSVPGEYSRCVLDTKRHCIYIYIHCLLEEVTVYCLPTYVDSPKYCAQIYHKQVHSYIEYLNTIFCLPLALINKLPCMFTLHLGQKWLLV